MAKAAPLPLYFFSALLFLLSISTTVIKGNPNGLTLKLIHRDSPESPLFAGNLTAAERHLRMVQQTRARASLLAARASSNGSSNALAKANLMGICIFLIDVGVGTFTSARQRTMPYFLGFDTGSALTWLQCDKCRDPGNHCFEQMQPLFPSSRSTTFRPVLCREEPNLCDPSTCHGELCPYTTRYVDGAESRGIMARDVFTFKPGREATGRTVMKVLLFGCGHDQRGFPNRQHNWMAGVMGVGWGEKSVVTQLGNRANGRFSYCIPVPDEDSTGPAPSTFVRFGADIPAPRQGHSTTRLLSYGNDPAFFVNVAAISLGRRRLAIDAAVFRRHDRVQGTVVDSGSEITSLIEPAFGVVAQALRVHFQAVPGAGEIRERSNWELCFKRPETMTVESMPSLTFHMEGGDMVIRPENVFIFAETRAHKLFCLAMDKSPTMTVIGAYQQRNQRLTYDMTRQELSFGPEACHSGA